jgi:DNA-binding NtrC family response regulator
MTDLSRPSLFPAAAEAATRLLRVVILDDVSGALEAIKMVIQRRFSNATILTFTKPEEALQELERQKPDLFTTDWCHPDPSGAEILRRLAAKKVGYPVFVISARAEIPWVERAVKEAKLQGLNIALLSKPFLIEELWRLMAEHLRLPAGDANKTTKSGE